MRGTDLDRILEALARLGPAAAAGQQLGLEGRAGRPVLRAGSALGATQGLGGAGGGWEQGIGAAPAGCSPAGSVAEVDREGAEASLLACEGCSPPEEAAMEALLRRLRRRARRQRWRARNAAAGEAAAEGQQQAQAGSLAGQRLALYSEGVLLDSLGSEGQAMAAEGAAMYYI